MTIHPENPLFKRMVVWVNSFEPGLWSNLSHVLDLDPEVGLALLQGFLELACGCQNVGNILSGRMGIQAMPREWVLEHIESVAEPLLQRGDDYKWWRLLEVYDILGDELARRLAQRAASHSNPDIREAGDAFLGA